MYAGIGGLVYDLLEITLDNDLGHAICNNIREGDWLINYLVSRLQSMHPPLLSFIQNSYSRLTLLTRGIIPKHFAKLTLNLYKAIANNLVTRQYTGRLFPGEDLLLQNLCLSSLQFYGDVPSSRTHMGGATLAAGLPHFSVEYTRCWGRDTFIALRGLFLVTGRF